MSRYVYVNGQYVPYAQASISIEDRGFQWGDSVYIVFPCYNDVFVDSARHFARLTYYAKAINFEPTFSAEIFTSICRELLHRNHLRNAAFYIQLTRGIARRIHWFPTEITKPSVIIMARPLRFIFDGEHLETINVVTTPDIRWARSFIKTNAALANVLLRQHAKEHNSFDCWLTDPEGFITEGASSNAFIVNKDGILQTRPDDGSIVAGVTRQRIIELARQNNVAVLEQPYTVKEALQAREAFITGATTFMKSVLRINDQPIQDGNIGPITRQLAKIYFQFIKSS